MHPREIFCLQYLRQMKNLQNFHTSLSTSLYTLSTILLLCIAITATAQNEYFEGNPNWNLDVEALGFGFNTDYFIDGDSMINELTYKRINTINYSYLDNNFFDFNFTNEDGFYQANLQVGKETVTILYDPFYGLNKQ